MNHRDTPFLRLLLPFIIGLIAGSTTDQTLPNQSWLLSALAALSVFFAFTRYQYRFRWVFGAVLNLLLCWSGYLLMVQHHEMLQKNHFSKLPVAGNYWAAEVYEAPSKGGRIKVPVRILACGKAPDTLHPASGNVLLLLDTTSVRRQLQYGDRLLFKGAVTPVEAIKNPYAFDYRRYLHFQNIHHQCFTNTDSVVVLSHGNGHVVWSAAYGCRDQLLALLKQHFPTTDEYAVASALLVGFKDDLSDEIQTAYAETGSMHALAVSGTHVGILYMGLLMLTQRLKLRGRWRLVETLSILAAIWAFTFLTGATASVLRASVMFSTYLLGKAAWRQASAWNVLPASAFLLLLYNPYFLFDVGFQLSYAAVAGMVFFYPRLYKLFPPGPRWVDEGLKVLLVGVAAQLGTLPLTLFYFNQFPIYFWLSGWIVVLGGAIFLWGGALLIVLNEVSTLLADWLGQALYHMVWWINKAIFLIQQLPWSVVTDIWIPAWVSAALYVGLFLLGAVMVWRRTRWLMAFLCLMFGLGTYRLHTLSKKQAQRAIVVYQVNKKRRLIDFFDGNLAYSLSDTLTQKQQDFAAKPLRVASAIRKTAPISFQTSEIFKGPNIFVEQPFVQFFDQKIAIIDAETPVDTNGITIAVDALILTNSPNVSIAACRRRFPFKTIVFDSSNSRRKVRRWQQECAAEGWAFHDVRTQGAWLWRF